MKFGTLGKILIGIGVIILMYAQFIMNVSRPGSDVVNLQLISERQNTLIIGGLIFIAGIVLFAVFKMKQTKAEEFAVIQKNKEINESIKGQLKSISATGEGYVSNFRKYFFRENENIKSILARLAFGLVMGVIAHDQVRALVYALITNHYQAASYSQFELADAISNISSMMIAALVLLYAFLAKQKLPVFRNMLVGYIALSGVIKLYAYLVTGHYSVWMEQDICAFLSIILLIYIAVKLRTKS